MANTNRILMDIAALDRCYQKCIVFLVNAEDIDFVAEGDASLSGHCTVHLKSGYILSGNWHKGQRKGPGNLEPTHV